VGRPVTGPGIRRTGRHTIKGVGSTAKPPTVAESPWAKPKKKKRTESSVAYWSKVVMKSGRPQKAQRHEVDERAPAPPAEPVIDVAAAKVPLPAVGEVLGGNYELLEEIGAGNIGTVFRARNRHSGDDVAVKIIHPHIASAPAAESRLRVIAKRAGAIENRAAEPVSDWGAERGVLYAVSRWLQGRPLSALLEESGRLKLRVVGRVVGKILNALEAGHQTDVIHGDLQANNVFIIEKPGEPHFLRVHDFELSVLATLADVEPDRLLRPLAVTPEQLAGSAPTVETDFYRVGWLVYSMLAGRPPYIAEGDTVAEQIESLRVAIEAGPPPPLTDFSTEPLLPGLVRLVTLMLEQDRQLRPGSVAEVRTLLRRAGKGEPVEVAPR